MKVKRKRWANQQPNILKATRTRENMTWSTLSQVLFSCSCSSHSSCSGEEAESNVLQGQVDPFHTRHPASRCNFSPTLEITEEKVFAFWLIFLISIAPPLSRWNCTSLTRRRGIGLKEVWQIHIILEVTTKGNQTRSVQQVEVSCAWMIPQFRSQATWGPVLW